MVSQKIQEYKNYLIILIIILAILYFGRILFIPLSFSVLISFLLYPVCNWFENRKVPRTLAVLICITLLILVGAILSFLLIKQISSFSHDWPNLSSKLPDAITEFKTFMIKLGIPSTLQNKWFSIFSSNSASEIFKLIPAFLYSSSLMAVSLILIPLFSALILLNRTNLVQVLKSLFKSEYINVVQRILHLIVKTYYDFIKGMILVYFIVGLLNSLGLLLLGIPHPFLFGFIASGLTFIPFVGIIIGSLLPMSVAWLTYNSIMYPLGVVAVFSIVQYLEANLIFPLSVSSRLKISSLATIISIIAGGILWGAAGMILFVPFVAILKLIADNTYKLEFLSLLLGRK